MASNLIGVNPDELSLEDRMEYEIKLSCIIKAQSVSRRYLVRCRVFKLLDERFEKILDPKRKRFYYYDRVFDKSSWLKPSLLRRNDLTRVSPTYLPDEAALMIQRQIHRCWALRRVRALYKTIVSQEFDPVRETTYYRNIKTGTTMWILPHFMGGRLDHNYEEDRSKYLAKRAKDMKAKLDAERAKAGLPLNSDDDDDDSKGGSDDDEVDDDDGDGESDAQNSEEMRQRRREKRKYPRSKAQKIVDSAEDDFYNAYELDLSGLGAVYFTSRIYDLHELSSINLSNNKLTHMSTNFQFLVHLEIINLCNNQISSIPKEIEEITGLREFLIGHNKLSTYPSNIYKLKSLIALDFSYNFFSSLPVETGNLELLKATGEWEVGIGLFTNLISFNLSYCKFAKWPAQLERCTSLTRLELQGNQLKVIPNLVEGLVHLSYLDLSHNQISSLPSEIYSLPLKTLLLGHNNLFELPPFDDSVQTGLTRLEYFDLSHNYIRKLHNILESFKNVQTFNGSYNMISFVSETIGSMTNLLTLNLQHNNIPSIPDEFIGCSSLRHCDLSYNNLKQLPTGLQSMDTMVYLNASYNEIADVPSPIFVTNNQIVELYLQCNKISLLPTAFFSLKALKTLDISHNHIKSFHYSIGTHMQSLQYLYASFNDLSSLPPTFVKCKALIIVELHCNNLTELPPGLMQLVNVTRLSLEKNNFPIAPMELFRMPRLISWNLSWNNRIVGQYRDFRKDDLQYFEQGKPGNKIIPLPTLKRHLATLRGTLDDLQGKVEKTQQLINFLDDDYYGTRKSPFQYLEATEVPVEVDPNRVGNEKYMAKISQKIKEFEAAKLAKRESIVSDLLAWQQRLWAYFGRAVVGRKDRSLQTGFSEQFNVETQSLLDALGKALAHRPVSSVSVPAEAAVVVANKGLSQKSIKLPPKQPKLLPSGSSGVGSDALANEAPSLAQVFEDAITSHLQLRKHVRRCDKVAALLTDLGTDRLFSSSIEPDHSLLSPDFMQIFLQLDLGYDCIGIIRSYENAIHEVNAAAAAAYYSKTRSAILDDLKAGKSNVVGDKRTVSGPETQSDSRPETQSGSRPETRSIDFPDGLTSQLSGPEANPQALGDGAYSQVLEPHPPSEEGSAGSLIKEPSTSAMLSIALGAIAIDGGAASSIAGAEHRSPPQQQRAHPTASLSDTATWLQKLPATLPKDKLLIDSSSSSSSHGFESLPNFDRAIWLVPAGDEIQTAAVEAYSGLAAALLLLSDKLAVVVREIECHLKVPTSALSVADRVCTEDYVDLIGDGLDLLKSAMKKSTKAATHVTIGSKKNQRVDELLAIGREYIEVVDFDVRDEPPPKEDAAAAVDKKKPKKGGVKATSGNVGSSNGSGGSKVTFKDSTKSPNDEATGKQSSVVSPSPSLTAPPPAAKPMSPNLVLSGLSTFQCKNLIRFLINLRRAVVSFSLLSSEFARELLRRRGYDDANPFDPKKPLLLAVEIEARAPLLNPARSLHVLRGRALAAAGRFDSASIELRTALSLSRNRDLSALRALAIVHCAAGDFAMAFTAIKLCIHREFIARYDSYDKLYRNGEIDVLEVWRVNRRAAYLYLYAQLHLTETEKCGVGGAAQRGSFNVAPNGLLTKETSMCLPSDLRHGTTPKAVAALAASKAARSALRAQESTATADAELVRGARAVAESYRLACDAVSGEIKAFAVVADEINAKVKAAAATASKKSNRR